MTAESPERPTSRPEEDAGDDATIVLPRPVTPGTESRHTEAHVGRRQAATVIAGDADGDRPRRIGVYEILDTLGEGGMGTVYLARQSEPFERRVALKLIRGRRPTPDQVRRFRSEGQALARMSHPAIAQVFEAGTSSLGESFIALEHVEGLPITAYADRARLSITERLRLFARVCDGIQHAHEKAVVHRDVKPSNVLVTERGGIPVPKIIDFGIAKVLDDESRDATRTRHWIGTPSYLSPEAIQGRATGADIDTRSDIYSLGVLLFELLVGKQPFGNDRSLSILKRIVDGETPRPRVYLRTLSPRKRAKLARRRGIDPRTHERVLTGELDWVVLRAMAKKRQDRYASAAELATDVRRFLAHEPVAAGPPSAAYRARKFVRRHRVGVTATLGMLAALVVGLALRSVEARRANFEAARASQQAEASRQVSDFLVSLFAGADPGGLDAGRLTALDLLEKGAARIDRELAGQPLVQARLKETIGNAYSELGRYDLAEPFLRQAAKLRDAEPDADPLMIAEGLVSLGGMLHLSGQLDESSVYLERARSVVARTADDGDLRRARALGTVESRMLVAMASVHLSRGETGQAEPALRRALALREVSEGDGPGVAAILNNLANVCFDEKRFDEAEALHLRSIAIKEAHLGPGHFHLAQSLNNLANVYLERGDGARAEPLHLRALEIKRKALPPDHVEIGVSLHNLADLAVDREAWEEATTLYEQAVAIFDRSLPTDHPFYGYSGVGLGETYHRLGRLDDSERWYRRAYTLRKDLADDSIYWREVVDGYGALLRDLGREQEIALLESRQLSRPES